MIQRQRPKRRNSFLPQIIFLILTFITAVTGVYVALQLFVSNDDTNAIPVIITVEVIITATPGPTAIRALVPAGNVAGQVDLPSGLAGSGTAGTIATVDAEQIGAVDVILSTPTPEGSGIFISDNCRYHTLVSGDTPFGVAERYGADPNLLLEVNNLTLQSAVSLQVGDRLLVPLDGCNVEGLVSSSGGTGTSAETSATGEVAINIADIEGIGDITAEGIHLRNDGRELNITGWTLSDSSGASYEFPELLLFPDVEIIIYTRSGTSTGYALFWGRDESVWEEGDELTLTDADGQVRKTLNIPEIISLE